MLFNSIDFAIFLPVFFILYWFVTAKSLRFQNLLILVASYVFYGWWDYRFLALIAFSTLVDYVIGLLIWKDIKQGGKNKFYYLLTSVLVNIGFLGFFKYYNFFVDNFTKTFTFFGYEFGSSTLNIILPVGISFYTFQTMSYTLDIYKGKLEPTKNFIGFAAFVSFFPQLVAGPIERASNLLPQILSKRSFKQTQALEGVRLILWGLFKKIVIADALAPSVDEIFTNYAMFPSQILITGAIFFAFQIYCDFSGYSDIARGLAKLLGMELMVNFNFPYFSRSIAEFWRKWHISLSTWFRDYLYIPLGGSRVGFYKSLRNVFIIFLVSGFWHGANWTFIAWGGIHALLFVPSFIIKNNRNNLEDLSASKFYLPSLQDVLKIFYTFFIVTIAWIFFRANSISIALDYIHNIFAFDFSPYTFLNPYDNQVLFKEYFYLILLIILEYFLITKILNFYSKNIFKGVFIDALLFVIIIINNPISNSLSFIYFQF
jgi:D-alanyl-lipoteichoic acid acyltransferase DltB (MBOAT superfamily)